MKSFVFDLHMFAMSFENGKISFTLNGLSVTLTGKNIKVDKKGVVTVSGKVNVITPTIKITKNCEKFLADVKCE